ncbi:MAG: YitT family protein [Clostridia bacterium]|nr:YitT family protein [Clostridia bacterium]
MKKQPKFLQIIFSYLLMTVGVVFLTVGVYFFKIPNGFVTGGVSGIGTVLGKALPILSSATWIAVINILLLLVGFIFVGKETGIRTTYCSLAFSFFSMILEKLVPVTAPLTTQPFLELVYAILLTAVGSAIMFSQSASSGGTDIVALILKKYSRLNVGQALLYSDFLICLSSFITFGVEVGLFSLAGLFAKAFLVDGIIDNINSCKYFVVITDKPEEVSAYVISELNHSVTTHKVVGGFSGTDKTMIHTVCHRIDAIRLRRKVKEIDPNAFTVITTTSEIVGRGFRGV